MCLILVAATTATTATTACNGEIGSVSPTEVDPAAPLAFVNPSILRVCQSNNWSSYTPTPTSIVYDCAGAPCPAQDGSQCSYLSQDVHDTSDGSPTHWLPTLAFVANGMAGELRWNQPPAIAAALFNAMGGTGIFFESEKADIEANNRGMPGIGTRKIWEDNIEAAGILLVEVRWQPGAAVFPGAPPTQGWFSRIDDSPRALPWAVKRPAAVLQFIRAHLPASVSLGTSGCSGGSIQTFAPILWYGLDWAVSYQYLSGPIPGAWDVPAVCANVQQYWGICENDPATSCHDDSPCNGFQCAFPQPTGSDDDPFNPLGFAVKAAIIDYGCMTDACLTGAPNACLNASSMNPQVPGARPGNFYLNHPIVINVGIGGSPTWLTDTSLGVAYNGASLYNQISSAYGKTYDVLTHATHCTAFQHDQLSTTLATIRDGLGAPAPGQTQQGNDSPPRNLKSLASR